MLSRRLNWYPATPPHEEETRDSLNDDYYTYTRSLYVTINLKSSPNKPPTKIAFSVQLELQFKRVTDA